MSILIGNTYYTNISPVMTGVSSPSPYVTECSITCISQFYKALDGNIDSYFRTNIQTVTPFAISLDYGEGNEKVVSAYILDCHYNVSFTMKSWNFEGSNDNNTWDILDSRSDISWSENAIQTFVFDNSTKYRYYRFNILEKNGTNSVCVNEIELLQEDSTSNLEFRKVKKSNLPNSKTDGVDAVYFTEDGEMYITDKNGNLKQSCGTKISADSNNAIKTKTDGLFVQDLSDKINQINFAQKTVNEGLDYCYCTLGDAISGQTYSINDTFPFTMSKSNNMTCNSSNHSIILKKGKTYRISSDIQCNLTSSNISISIYNLTKGMNLTSFHKTVNNTASESAGTAIYTPDLDDEEIIVKIISLTGTANGTIKPTDFGYFIAEEIGRAITIDPLEYANSESGIEDTPVGHIIPYMGNNAPKHYLICDGTEYNIIDYPYLVQHFTNEFGSSNYFGGDGTTTFAVPDLRGEFLRGSGTNNHTNQGSGSNVGVHQDGTEHIYFGVNTNTQEFWTDTITPRKESPTTQMGIGKMDSMLKLTTQGSTKGFRTSLNTWNGATNQSHYTSRPTNTSVLYCIKYEPTYFMKYTYSADSVNYTDEEIQEAVAKVLGGTE